MTLDLLSSHSSVNTLCQVIMKYFFLKKKKTQGGHDLIVIVKFSMLVTRTSQECFLCHVKSWLISSRLRLYTWVLFLPPQDLCCKIDWISFYSIWYYLFSRQGCFLRFNSFLFLLKFFFSDHTYIIMTTVPTKIVLKSTTRMSLSER